MKYILYPVSAVLLFVCIFQFRKTNRMSSELEVKSEQLSEISRMFQIDPENENKSVVEAAQNIKDLQKEEINAKTLQIQELERQMKSMNAQLKKALSLNRNSSSLMIESQKQKKNLEDQIFKLQNELFAKDFKIRKSIANHIQEIKSLQETMKREIKLADSAGYRRGMEQIMTRQRPDRKAPSNFIDEKNKEDSENLGQGNSKKY